MPCLSTRAGAGPQWTGDLQTGVCGRGAEGDWGWAETCWFGGLYGDVLFGRERSSDWGLGPHLRVATANFGDLRVGGGATVQIPFTERVGTTLSVAALAMRSDAWAPGAGAELFVGARSYDFGDDYGPTAGLVLGAQRRFGDAPEVTWLALAQVDFEYLALPWVFLVNAVR